MCPTHPARFSLTTAMNAAALQLPSRAQRLLAKVTKWRKWREPRIVYFAHVAANAIARLRWTAVIFDSGDAGVRTSLIPTPFGP
jgi:hypothetical protein